MIVDCLNTQDKQTPLHEASFNGHQDVMRYLIQKGCPVDVESNVRAFHCCVILVSLAFLRSMLFGSPPSFAVSVALTMCRAVIVMVTDWHDSAGPGLPNGINIEPLYLIVVAVRLESFGPVCLLQGKLAAARLLIEQFKADAVCAGRVSASLPNLAAFWLSEQAGLWYSLRDWRV